MSSGEIKILIVDDNPMMRLGLSGSLSVEPGLVVIGEAGSGNEALECVRKEQPDVITMDYQMPDENGLVVSEKILAEYPNSNIILLSAFDSEENIWNAVRVGVKGCLTKSSGDVEELVEAVRTVAAGETYFPAKICRKIEARSKQPDLSSRELDVLQLLAEGMSNKEIAKELKIADETVKHHISNLRVKLGAADRTQAVALAYKKGILRVGE